MQNRKQQQQRAETEENVCALLDYRRGHVYVLCCAVEQLCAVFVN